MDYYMTPQEFHHLRGKQFATNEERVAAEIIAENAYFERLRADKEWVESYPDYWPTDQ